MQNLIVRRLLVDMEKPIQRHWCDGNEFITAFFNALSMSFPVGEQVFIDSVKRGLAALPSEKQNQFRAEVQGFIGQEATHRRLHDLYNGHLEKLGYENLWEKRIKERTASLMTLDPRHALAVTAANEHFTAIFADWLLNRPEILGNNDPRLATLWMWHSAEESEHRNTAFDLYIALDGDNQWRQRWFKRITTIFICDVARQIARNLHKDKLLLRPRIWAQGFKFLFGKTGLLLSLFRPWADYKKPEFHPSQHDGSASSRWLTNNKNSYAPVTAV